MTRLSRAESQARTRKRLLDAAAAIIAERGITGMSVEHIAERAGFTRGAFYGNFADKHDIVMALLEQRTQGEFDELRAMGRDAGSFERMLDQMRQRHRERARHADEWFVLRTELWLYALRHTEVADRLARHQRRARAAIEAGITHEFRTAAVQPPADPALLALIVHALGDGLLAQRMLTPDEIPDEIIVDAVSLLLRSWTALAQAPEG
ncbi:TetR/AcrR family transcriptional regulator [Actinoplanes auranticolor]|uniref:TetR/AcrR family transcriptional regulator n=1 Tax=Actinoplanes auranticolor TaxID=47988 RepID=UPI001BB43411|nr:TetR/AcrR family transcriptional regulator [Actinoplanes auranticolor]